MYRMFNNSKMYSNWRKSLVPDFVYFLVLPSSKFCLNFKVYFKNELHVLFIKDPKLIFQWILVVLLQFNPYNTLFKQFLQNII